MKRRGNYSDSNRNSDCFIAEIRVVWYGAISTVRYGLYTHNQERRMKRGRGRATDRLASERPRGRREEGERVEFGYEEAI